MEQVDVIVTVRSILFRERSLKEAETALGRCFRRCRATPILPCVRQAAGLEYQTTGCFGEHHLTK